jgi:hypothetical protein
MMVAAAEAPPRRKAPRKPAAAKKSDDAMLAAIDALQASLTPMLAEGLRIVRDNPGRTPQQWSIRNGDDATIVSLGLIDRTFFWTWDEGVGNHYTKVGDTMTRVITDELRRFGHIS